MEFNIILNWIEFNSPLFFNFTKLLPFKGIKEKKITFILHFNNNNDFFAI